MKTGCCIGLLACLALASFAQSGFQKSIDVFLTKPFIRVTPDGKHVYVAATETRNSVTRTHVYQLDKQGNILWHQEQFNDDVHLTLKSADVTSDGIVLMLSSYISPKMSNGYLVKFSTNGTLAWDRQIGTKNFTQLFEIQTGIGNRLWLSGLHLATSPSDSFYYFLAKLDSLGKPEKSTQNYFRYFAHSDYEQCQFTDLVWNENNQSLMYVEDFAGPYSYSAIASFSRGRFALGYCDTVFHFDEIFINYQMSNLESAGKTLFFSGWNTLENVRPDKTAIGILRETGKQDRMIKRTPSLYRPIHSYANYPVYYIEQDKTLVQFDLDLNPVWAVKLDNCTATTGFGADIAADGRIYTVRNINNRTIVAGVSPDGTLKACISYPQQLPKLTLEPPSDIVGYFPGGYPSTTLTDTLHRFNFMPQASISMDFCVKMDASFEMADTVCIGAEISPQQIDTTEGLGHTWDSADFRTEDSLPTFPFKNLGLQKVYHRVETALCQDTASRYVQVIPRPTLALGDTLVCGPASLELDLRQPAATRYFLDGQPTPPLLQIDQTGIFSIRAANKACSDEKMIQVKIVAFEPPVLPLDSSYCPSVPVKVALRSDFDQLVWDQKPVQDTFTILDGDLHRYQARYKPDTSCLVSGNYKVPRKICGATEAPFYAPNVFAPKTGAENAVFQAFPKADVRLTTMRIFDRWGALVYQSAGDVLLWDGTAKGREASIGIYTYWIEYQDLGAETLKVKSGEVLLLR